MGLFNWKPLWKSTKPTPSNAAYDGVLRNVEKQVARAVDDLETGNHSPQHVAMLLSGTHAFMAGFLGTNSRTTKKTTRGR